MSIIPDYNITGQQVTPQEILDVIPEQERSDNAIQASEERYLQGLEQNAQDRIRNTEKTWSQIADLSNTFGNILKERQEKFRADREAQIKLDILTRGVSPELEARFRGERDKLFEDDLATQEFASKYEEETGDSITAQEFRNMAGWEKYMVAEQYALQKAKDYDQYVYQAYETTKIDVVRDGQSVSVGHLDNLSPAEQAALDTKIKFEYAKQFAGLNEALVATVVKPEIDKFDAARRKKQAVEREANYQAQVKSSDTNMIRMGFVTANPEDGHQLAHDWAARYAARNRTTISAGRLAFKENLIDLVKQDQITYSEALSIVNHEITARDGSTKTMGSWKEWAGLNGELASAASAGVQAREDKRQADVIADVELIRSNPNATNEQKAIMMDVYRQKYDGYVPNEIADALRGHMEDWQAEDMIEKSVRYQGGVYDFEAKNLSTEMYNKHKDKILSSGAMVPGSSDHKLAAQYLRGYTNRGTEESFGETDTKSPEWLTLYGNLENAFNQAYEQATVRDGKIIGRPEDGMKAGLAAVETIINNPSEVIRLQNFNTDVSDGSYSRLIQNGMTQSSNGNWKKKKVSATQASQKELIAWGQTPLKQSSDIPDYYKDLAMRMGVNPVDLANSQLKYVSGEEVKQEEKKEEHSKEVETLVYKYPTRSRITRARILDELNKMAKKHGEKIDPYLETKPNFGINPNVIQYKRELPRDPLLRQQVIKARKEAERERGSVKTSIFNKKALVRQDQ
tara:strand:+ start:762 stop:2984 length:2223 start_codon:yes stop_codon:yes gene_type:complete